jgi:drug/metabolite transporter (DMT)-like permease
MTYIGELAALATSVLFAATSTFFTLAGRQIGTAVLNRTRLVFAILFLIVAHLAFRIPLPIQAGTERWLWLSLSGIIGLALGDTFLYKAFIWIGPRMGMLMMSLAPVISALLAWLFLSEQLTFIQILGILVTLTGIGWVVIERQTNGQSNQDAPHHYVLGILCGLGAAACQAGGLVTAKLGTTGDYPALSGTLIRMVAAAIILWGLTFLRGEIGTVSQQIQENRRALKLILLGATTGPFIGVTLSLVAVQRAEVGVASTLMALPPIVLLPISHYVFKERFGWQAVAGTFLALAGVGVLFLA